MIQIKKKRKRTHPVDPCLGFYPSSPPQTFIKQVPAIVTPSHLNATLDSTHTSSDCRDDENIAAKVLTIEEFLQRSAKNKPPKKNYGKRKRRIAILTSDLQGIISPTS